MKLKSLKIHGVKMHTPTFHVGGRKYKPGYWAQLKTSRRGNIGLSWRSGWREHEHNDKPVNTARVDRRLSSIFRPVASAAGIGHNALRSSYG